MRDLLNLERLFAANLCDGRNRRDHRHASDIVDGCPTCRADIVVLVDAPPAIPSEDAVDDLVARGYDLTTLRFSIRKPTSPSPEAAT